MKNEPKTDGEFEAALEELGCELIDHDADVFSIHNRLTGSTTKLDAEEYSDALFEAWHLVKE